MASTALTKAIAGLERAQKQRKARAQREKSNTAALIGRAGSLVGAAAAAYHDANFLEPQVDPEFGEQLPAETMGIPHSALVGGAAIIAGALLRGEFGLGVAGTGWGAVNGSLYGKLHRRFKADAEKKPQT